MHATPNRGIHSENFAVLVRTAGCAALVEGGFLSNKAKPAHFASAKGQERLAEALLLGILRARPIAISDPPETEIAKCEAYAKHLQEKEHRRRTSTPTPSQPRPRIRIADDLPSSAAKVRC